MIVALDIDGTITANPLFFKHLHDAWLVSEKRIVFLTARPESQRISTINQLNKLSIPVENNLYMFPQEYCFPFESSDAEVYYKKLHASWKARTCVQLGVSVLIDDCEHNVSACRAAGIFVLQVIPPNK